MKLIPTLIAATILVAPALLFAQQSQPLTRAQVRADLVLWENAGYNPSGENPQYPADAQAAGARIAAHQNAVSAN